MKVKKYVGKTIQDTIFKVKAEMGSDAIILDTRKFKTGGFLGFFQNKKVEVIAALEEDENDGDNNSETIEQINDIKRMIADLKEDNESKSSSESITEEFMPFFKYLIGQGVKKKYCKKIIGDIKSDKNYLKSQNILPKTRDYLLDLIGETYPIKIDNSPEVITFIGPTGVGKTTTIAKIAAEFTVNDKKKVGIITIDTYRVAAVQQLETYSELLDIPLKVIYNSENFRQIMIRDFKDFDLVLVDTPGSSWRDKFQLGKLKKFILSDTIDEVHLLLNLSTKTQDLISTVDHFSCLEPDRILLTKLDETSTYGDIINLRKKFDIPFSYITFGQSVPEDIKIARAEILLDYILGDYYG